MKQEASSIQIAQDRKLVKRMLANDESAFNTFIDEYLPRLYRYARHRLGNDQDIEDIVQKALINATRHIETYRGDSTLLTWLISICRNEIARHLDKVTRERDLMSPFMNDDILRSIVESLESPPADEPEALLLRADMVSTIQFALDQLPNHYAKALELKYIQGCSSQEIALQLNMGDVATQSLLARARNAFREVCSEAMLNFLEQSPASCKAGDI